MGAALKEGLPLKLVKKQGDTVSAAVVRLTRYGNDHWMRSLDSECV